MNTGTTLSRKKISFIFTLAKTKKKQKKKNKKKKKKRALRNKLNDDTCTTKESLYSVYSVNLRKLTILLFSQVLRLLISGKL